MTSTKLTHTVIPFSDTIDFVSSGSDARREICY